MTTVVRVIQETVAEWCGITLAEMLSRKRTRDICWPRQLAIYVAVQLVQGTHFGSLPYIGRQFGNMDHTTIMHAVKAVEKAKEEGSRPWLSDLPAIRAACVVRVEHWRRSQITAFASLGEPYRIPTMETARIEPLPEAPPITAPREVHRAYYELLQAYKRLTIRYPSHMSKESAHEAA